MNSTSYNRAGHFSIVWGVTLAVITLVEWYSLERDPVRQEIMSPFIQRSIAVSVENASIAEGDIASVDGAVESPDAELRYDVEFNFNGPFFLACFFGPMLIFHGIGMLWNRR